MVDATDSKSVSGDRVGVQVPSAVPLKFQEILIVMTALWRFSKTQYNRVLRAAGTALAVRLMLLFAILESIIIPIPVDPLLIATVLARPKNWIKLVAACTSASVIGGGLGWAIGVWLGVGVEQLLVYLPHAVAAPEKFTAVHDGFLEWGILLVFIGAFSPLPYKVIAVSAGVAGFGLAPFLITSLIGRGLRFAIVAGITRHHGDPRIVIILISALVTMIGGALWLVQ
jgi:membrane protein YqaA with SNARE-associated domain